MVKAAVIPAAGLGTRMTPYSKEVPKEMLPIIYRKDDNVVVEPVLHFIFDSLYEVGIRVFYIVVGRGKRIIEDYFTPDWEYVEYLRSKGKELEAHILEELYIKLDKTHILLVNQPRPKGFGDAVFRTRNFMTYSEFLVHAGDDITFPDHVLNIKRLMHHFTKKRPKAVFLYTKSEKPERYGVILGEDLGDYIIVNDILEKPKKPPSNNVVVAIYIFDKLIYEFLEEVKPKENNREHQLTDAIKMMLDTGEEVHAIPVIGSRLDFGTPDNYYKSLKILVESMKLD